MSPNKKVPDGILLTVSLMRLIPGIRSEGSRLISLISVSSVETPGEYTSKINVFFLSALNLPSLS